MHRKKKNIKLKYNWSKLQKLTPINISKKNLMSRQQQHNCFNKMRYGSIEIVFNLNSKKEFCFCSSVYEAETFFDIMIFWVGGKNSIVKNEKCIVFPEQWYINLNHTFSYILFSETLMPVYYLLKLLMHTFLYGMSRNWNKYIQKKMCSSLYTRPINIEFLEGGLQKLMSNISRVLH